MANELEECHNLINKELPLCEQQLWNNLFDFTMFLVS